MPSKLAIPMALLAVLALSGCATTADTQAKIDTGAAIACAGFEAGDTLFNAYAKNLANNITADKIKTEAAIYAGLHALCVQPYTLDVPTMIKKATDATVAIAALMAQ